MPLLSLPFKRGGSKAMARRRSRIVRKALDFIALGLTPMANVKKHIARKLLFFKRTKRLRLLRHYNYAFIAEYEFSPSNCPLFRYPRAPLKKRSRFLSLLCCGNGAESVADGGACHDELEMLSPNGVFRDELKLMASDAGGVEIEPPAHELLEYGDEEDATIDQRAERFIEKFYEEMRIQRQKSDAARRHLL